MYAILKTQYYLRLQSYKCDIICGNKKIKNNITQKEIKLPFAWCSWIFDLTADGQDTTIIKLTHYLFSSERYIPMSPGYGIITSSKLLFIIWNSNLAAVYQATDHGLSWIMNYEHCRLSILSLQFWREVLIYAIL